MKLPSSLVCKLRCILLVSTAGQQAQSLSHMQSNIAASSNAASCSDPSKSAEGQNAEEDSPPVGRQRAEAAITCVPHPSSTQTRPPAPCALPHQPSLQMTLQSPPSLQSPAGQQQEFAQLDRDLSDTNEDHSDHSQNRSQEAAPAGLTAETVSDHEADMQSKLVQLTQRLDAAEQAAKHHSELHSQLLQIKADKTALQSDLKQFMEHTSTCSRHFGHKSQG